MLKRFERIFQSYQELANVKEMHNEFDGFLVHGFVDDAFEALNSAKVLLAPLRFGAGLKGKLVLAMQAGTPCAMSSIAAEGIFGNLPPNGIIQDNSDEFAAHAVTLYTNTPQWTTAQNQGFSVLKARFENHQHMRVLANRIKTLLGRLETHRAQNSIGQMLSHHQLQSTKYMARWIEAKNR